MDRNDEALMREAFAEYWTKLQSAEQLRREADDLASSWLDGPYAQHWEYLATAVSDWSAKPGMMRRYTTLLADGRAMPDVMTDLDTRSIYQSQLLADPDKHRHRVVAPEDQQFAVELIQAQSQRAESVPDAGTAVDLIKTAHPNVNGTPDALRADTIRNVSLMPTPSSGTDHDLNL